MTQYWRVSWLPEPLKEIHRTVAALPARAEARDNEERKATVHFSGCVMQQMHWKQPETKSTPCLAYRDMVRVAQHGPGPSSQIQTHWSSSRHWSFALGRGRADVLVSHLHLCAHIVYPLSTPTVCVTTRAESSATEKKS